MKRTKAHPPELRCERLSRWYGKVAALQNLNLTLRAGVWGLLGPNGSGKTTLLRLAAGQLRPSLGSIRLSGQAPFANPAALARVGFCPEADALYEEFTGLEFVSKMAELSGFSPREAKERALQSLETFGLQRALHRRVGGYSRGMRQRVKLAQAVVHDPDILLLDEPFTGTDPTSRAVILEQLRLRGQRGALVLLSTHLLHEVESLTDRILLLARGQVVAQGRVHEIRALLEEHPHHIRVVCDRPRELARALIDTPGVVSIHFSGDSAVEFESERPDEAYPAICAELLRGEYRVESLTSPDATLEALFHYLTERANRSGAESRSPRARFNTPVFLEQARVEHEHSEVQS